MGLAKSMLADRRRGKGKGKEVSQPVLRRSKPKPMAKWVREGFEHWFNHGWEAIAKEDGNHWKTFKHPLSPDKIWEYWNAAKTAIGLRFGKTTKYGMLDIDAPSKYHNAEGLTAIKDALAILGIEDSLLIQSSNSGGWHLYFFLPQAISTFALACGLQDALEMVGLELKNGQLEAFPNRKSRLKEGFTLYNGHRLPMQTGSALLDEDGIPYSQSIELFLRQAQQASTRVDWDLLLSTCQDAHQLYTAGLFANKTKHQPLAKQFGGKRLLRELNNVIEAGWTAHGMSNDILGAIAAKGRIFQGLADQALADWIYQTAIDAPGFEQYCRHQRECPAWAVRWARCAQRKYYPYGTRKGGEFKSLKEAGPTNQQRQADSMQRIVEAVTDFETSGRSWPKTIRRRRALIAKLSCCSERTLAKPVYLPVWHPDHVSLSNARNPHSGGASAIPQKCDPTPSITVGTPLLPQSEDSVFGFPENTNTATSCTIPGDRQKTKPPQTHTQQGIEAFSEQKTVPIKPRLAIVKNSQPLTQQGTQPPPRIVNRPKLAIADPNPLGWKPGDLVVEMTRPDLLLRVESIDLDGEWCRCRDIHWGRRELCLLSELNHAPPDLIANYFPTAIESTVQTS